MVNQPASDVKLAQKSNHKLLKGQIREISQQLRLTLASADGPQKREQGDVVSLMESADNFFRQRGIVFNIECFEKKIAGKMEMIVQLDCHYGLKERINNLNSFLDFCAIHGFMPMIDKIIINGKEVSQIKELYSLFSFALFEKDPLIANIMVNEIEKLEDSLQKPMKDILHYIHSITEYTTKTYQYLLGNHAQKLRNEGVVSESIFAELTLRLENEIRKQVGIASSYMKLANYTDDTEKKTDMNFVFKKTPGQNYNFVPVQFTISANSGLEKKKTDIENFLFQQLFNKKPVRNNFLLLSVNGAFKQAFSEKGEFSILKEYKEWLDAREEREKTAWGKFPLFIDTIDQKVIRPAEVMYIALHMLYKKYDFRYATKDSYLNSVKKCWKINKMNTAEIEGIQLADIMVEKSAIQELRKGSGEKEVCILKHEYLISYQGQLMGTIVVYGI